MLTFLKNKNLLVIKLATVQSTTINSNTRSPSAAAADVASDKISLHHRLHRVQIRLRLSIIPRVQTTTCHSRKDAMVVVTEDVVGVMELEGVVDTVDGLLYIPHMWYIYSLTV